MVDWQRANRSGAHGTHRYTAEEFGLTTTQLHSDYDFYIRRFDVEVEGADTHHEPEADRGVAL